MRTLFGILLPLIIIILPVLYLIYYGIKRLRSGKGKTISALTGIALLIGLVTPLLSIVASVIILSLFDQDSIQCYTFVAGYIVIGIIVEIAIIPLTTVILKITEEVTDSTS